MVVELRDPASKQTPIFFGSGRDRTGPSATRARGNPCSVPKKKSRKTQHQVLSLQHSLCAYVAVYGALSSFPVAPALSVT